MINIQDIVDFMEKNKGKEIPYADKFYIQVYDGSVLQANISFKAESSFLKIEQRAKESITIFLEEIDAPGIIDYSNGCELSCSENVLNLFKSFSKHPQQRIDGWYFLCTKMR